MSLERNKRVEARYDELMREGKHGHYETMFRVVREQLESALSEQREADAKICDERAKVHRGRENQCTEEARQTTIEPGTQLLRRAMLNAAAADAIEQVAAAIRTQKREG